MCFLGHQPTTPPRGCRARINTGAHRPERPSRAKYRRGSLSRTCSRFKDSARAERQPAALHRSALCRRGSPAPDECSTFLCSNGCTLQGMPVVASRKKERKFVSGGFFFAIKFECSLFKWSVFGKIEKMLRDWRREFDEVAPRIVWRSHHIRPLGCAEGIFSPRCALPLRVCSEDGHCDVAAVC